MATETQTMAAWIGHDLIEEDGSKIGRIENVYVDVDSSRPEWVAVTTGWFGSRMSFVPLDGLESDGEHLISPWSKSQVKDAPTASSEGELSREDEDRLYQHYGRSRGTGTTGTPMPSGDERARTTDRTPGRGAGRDDAMTRSEEELRASTTERPTERVRLRKWVETEHETVTVPVRKERARIEREPITDANRDAAMRGPEISEGEHEITLTEEEPRVETEVVPKERVRLEKDVEVDQERVEADVRKEHVAMEGDDRSRRR